jgi:acyl-CoA synthetase (AMP-forming)/AMP-acid ligase II
MLTLDARIAAAARRRGGITFVCGDVVPVAPGSLPKSSAGKLPRSACCDRYRRGER